VLQGEETGRNGKAAGVQEGWKGQLGIDVEIFEVTPAFYVVEVKKSAGETLEYEFCNKDLRPSLKDIYWTSQPEGKPSSLAESSPLLSVSLVGLRDGMSSFLIPEMSSSYLILKNSINIDTYTRISTHPYEHTYIYHITISTSEKLSQLDLEIHKVNQ
jgi:hypothetical protein